MKHVNITNPPKMPIFYSIGVYIASGSTYEGATCDIWVVLCCGMAVAFTGSLSETKARALKRSQHKIPRIKYARAHRILIRNRIK
jgi:hypothetical protein